MAEPLFINPFTDFGFKKIFGEEQNKDLLIDFLNELLAAQNQHISELVFKKNDRLGSDDLDRNVVFDLYCENKLGEKFIVELQKPKQAFFKNRVLSNSALWAQKQALENNSDCESKAIYKIAILDFVIDEENADKIIVRKQALRNLSSCEELNEKLTHLTFQLPNFTKQADNLASNFDKWLYVIKNLNKLDHIPSQLEQGHLFQKLFKIASYSALTKDEKAKYDDSVKYYNDLKNVLDTAYQEGYRKAKAMIEARLLAEKALCGMP
jgi:predicted transposase/invertase (TIGR01784 family)